MDNLYIGMIIGFGITITLSFFIIWLSIKYKDQEDYKDWKDSMKE